MGRVHGHVCTHVHRNVYGRVQRHVYRHVYRHMHRHLYGHAYRNVLLFLLGVAIAWFEALDLEKKTEALRKHMEIPRKPQVFPSTGAR